MRKGLFLGAVIAIVLLAAGMATAQGTVKIGYLAALTGDWAHMAKPGEGSSIGGGRN